MISKLYRFCFLPVELKILRIQSVLLVTGIRFGIWLLPYRTVSRYAEKLAINNMEPREADPEKVKLMVEYIESTSRFVPSASCLVQALAAKTLLGMWNYGSELRIGVEKTSKSEIAAHAWLEINGEIVIGEIPGHERYKVLETTPVAGRS